MSERDDRADRGPRPWSEVTTPTEVRIPPRLALLLSVAVAGGVILGALTSPGIAQGLVRATFFGSAFGYLAVSLVDFREHFLLEKEVTGRYLAGTVIPLGETLNHAATGLVITLFLVLARPPVLHSAGGVGGIGVALRDLYCLAAPGLFLALGWRDEIVYHRRRSSHREDLMHTVAHLGAATMFASFVAMRMVSW